MIYRKIQSRNSRSYCQVFSIQSIITNAIVWLLLMSSGQTGVQAQSPSRLTNINTAGGSTIGNLYADPTGRYLYFTAKPGSTDQEWYRLTVADNSVAKISSDFVDVSGVIMRQTFRVGNNVFFAGAKGFNGTNPDLEFNRLDLNTGTFQYQDLNPNGVSSDASGGFVEDANGDVLFLASGPSGTQVYKWKKSDQSVTNVNPQTATNSWNPSQNAGIA